MPIPELSHLQFLILSVLGSSERSGKEIRSSLAAEKMTMSMPAFYQLMSRLEAAKFVVGRYKEVVIDDNKLRERAYKITGAGSLARQAVVDFYERQPVFGTLRGRLAT